jgi:hypothetical protein
MKAVVYENENGGEVVLSYERYGIENIIKIPFINNDKGVEIQTTREFLYDITGILNQI